MNLSKKISKLSLSPTLALNAKANQMKKDGVDVVNFSIGEPDFPTKKVICDIAIEQLQKGATKYGVSGGGEEIRTAICEKLKRENKLHFSPKQVVCGAGAKEILFHTFMAILNPGDEVILSAPCWISYKDQILAVGGVPVIIPMPKDPSKGLVTPEMIEAYASSRTVAVVVCSPNNPAGYCLNKDEMKALASYFKTKNWWVISDEIYEYFSFSHSHVSLLQLEPELADRCIHINGMSKSFAMTGWRVGYAAGPENLISLVRVLQSHSSTCLPIFIEKAATFALNAGRELMAPDLAIMKKKRDLTISFLDSIKDISYIYPHGAFYAFIDLRSKLALSEDFKPHNSLGFCQYLLERFHVAAVPGEAFEAPGFMRVTYAVDEAALAKGFERLKEALDSIRE